MGCSSRRRELRLQSNHFCVSESLYFSHAANDSLFIRQDQFTKRIQQGAQDSALQRCFTCQDFQFGTPTPTSFYFLRLLVLIAAVVASSQTTRCQLGNETHKCSRNGSYNSVLGWITRSEYQNSYSPKGTKDNCKRSESEHYEAMTPTRRRHT